MATTSTTKKPTPKRPLKQQALVVGISAYAPPLSKLPAVAADAREIAKVLSSRKSTFPSGTVQVLTEKQATREAVLAALKKVFSGAKTTDTVFVYLAGHGAKKNGAYYYVAQDTEVSRLSDTGVALSEIKQLFDQTTSRRAFLWLDCCHSGGILARGGSITGDLSTIKREIAVVHGQGKIILAACTSAQSAYEDPALGHGLFTHALLRGLKGAAKDAHGEVTAASLYDFIDREVQHPGQRPVFSGEMTGRVVLMHYPAAGQMAPAKTVKASKATKAAAVPAATKTGAVQRVSSSGKNLLLGGRVYLSRSATERNDGSWEVRLVANTAEKEASLRSLRADEYSRNQPVSFAFGNQGFHAEVSEATAHMEGATSIWEVLLKPVTQSRGYMGESAYGELSVEQLAELRARLVLLGETPPSSRQSWSDGLLSSFVLGDLEGLGVKGAVLPVLKKAWKGTPTDFLRHARLWLAYYLKVGRVCDDILELTLGPLARNGVGIRFRGQRKSRYSGKEPYELKVQGICRL